jgi:superfamily II DNA/RNA helicase
MLLSGGFERPLKRLVALLDEAEHSTVDSTVDSQSAKRQFVFAAATMHASGKLTPGETLKLGFPNAVWLSGARLHKPPGQLAHVWREVSSEEDAAAVFDALSAQGSAEKTLVFVNTASSATRLAAELGARFDVARLAAYGAEQTSEERNAALSSFRSHAADSLAVLVCTDAAARGLDVPGVRHVIQAGFAQSAVDFLHRAGRACRLPGSSGTLTSLVAPGAQRLAAAVRGCVEAGEGAGEMEGAFSRKRSFSKKFKRYGPSRQGVPDPEKARAMAERRGARDERMAARRR